MEAEFSISSAMLLTGLSRSTIRRAIADGKIPNAYKNSGGVWRLPISGLLAAGFTPVADQHVIGRAPEDDSETIQELKSRIETLESERSHLRELLAQSQHSTRLAEELADTYKRLITDGSVPRSLNTVTTNNEHGNEHSSSAQKIDSSMSSHDQETRSLNTSATTNEHGSLWSRLRAAFRPDSEA